MMLEPALSKLLKKVPGRYHLVNVVAQRARKISQDAEDKGIQLAAKPVTMALNEIVTGEK